MEAGTYRLTETKTAEGYNLLSAPIVIPLQKMVSAGLGMMPSCKPKRHNLYRRCRKRLPVGLDRLEQKDTCAAAYGVLIARLPLAVAGLLILVFRYNKKGGTDTLIVPQYKTINK